MRRYIYIHGSPDSVEMGKPGSIGVACMRNGDLLELFDLVSADRGSYPRLTSVKEALRGASVFAALLIKMDGSGSKSRAVSYPTPPLRKMP